MLLILWDQHTAVRLTWWLPKPNSLFLIMLTWSQKATDRTASPPANWSHGSDGPWRWFSSRFCPAVGYGALHDPSPWAVLKAVRGYLPPCVCHRTWTHGSILSLHCLYSIPSVVSALRKLRETPDAWLPSRWSPAWHLRWFLLISLAVNQVLRRVSRTRTLMASPDPTAVTRPSLPGPGFVKDTRSCWNQLWILNTGTKWDYYRKFLNAFSKPILKTR